VADALKPNLHVSCVRELQQPRMDFLYDAQSRIVALKNAQEFADDCRTNGEHSWALIRNINSDADERELAVN